MAEAVDTLICIVPKTPDTFKTVNADILSALGSNGVLINVGRGWTVDEDALETALQGVLETTGFGAEFLQTLVALVEQPALAL